MNSVQIEEGPVGEAGLFSLWALRNYMPVVPPEAGDQVAEEKEMNVGVGPISLPEHMRPQYSNYVNVNHTPWDFRLTFAVVKAPTPGTELEQAKKESLLVADAVADIIIPANLVHGLISALQDNFSKYLDKFGPPGLDPRGPGRGEG